MRLGEILIDRRSITQEDLDRALELQAERGDKLGKILVDLGFAAQRDILSALAQQLEIPLVSIEGPPAVSPEIETLSPKFLRQFRCLPVAQHDHTVTLAMADPLDFETRSTVASCTGLAVNAGLAAEQEILDAIDRYYGQAAKNEAEAISPSADAEDLEHLRDMASEAPVIRLVNAMIAQAVEKRASDIHIEPFEKEFRIRYRIDGVLVSQDPPPRELKAAIISRVKLMARLNIAERRLPQDGRIKIKTLGREVDLRVSTLPTLYGESVVMRLLDRSAGDFYDLERLGFDAHMLSRMQYYTSLPHGIFLVTGPTGSGKSTTLYAALKRINQTDKKIITIEDPVEYQMDGINQIHVNPQIGLTFAQGLRHIVRQDPDVIMVGEVRDRETADIAIRAALTGHFVYSTLHTNDAPSAITRLSDMGVENYLMTSSLVAVLAQRLVRVICEECKTGAGTALTPEGETIAVCKGAGCDHCFGTGFRGRVGIFELMELNEELRGVIMRNEDASKITACARRHGMRNLREDGWLKVRRGVTSPEEVTRVTQEF
ncbi:MAG: Flp pilus assembly complex ATPase component TadA [Bryobacterales bacterium]|nr:Flp pilus assembly complex ATPase component TadA [Bryobacterales bacterium]MBV9397148.1 Flp pilus assembly complex ATPase component TadA [Bryobacterales bacterium]